VVFCCSLHVSSSSFLLLVTRLYITDKKLKLMFLAGFSSFVASNPSSLWQAQALQRVFMHHNLGHVYWESKMEQFRQMRLELGVRLA
jgi:hypothetical protein